MINELMQKVAEVDPGTHQFLVTSAPAVQSSPFKDEIVDELDGIMKKAGMMGGAATQLGVNIGSGIAMALAGDMYNAMKRGITKSTYYRNMLDANPDLKQMDAKDVQNAFSTLHQFNPEFASNPHVAGSYVRKNAQFPEFDATQLNNLVSSHKNISDTKKLPSGGVDISKFREDPTDKLHKETQTRKLLQEMEHKTQLHPLQMSKALREDGEPSTRRELDKLKQHSGQAARIRASR
jgi:hypothetical protein